MALIRRAVLIAVASLVVLTGAVADAKRKPPYRTGCQLVTTPEVSSIMGRRMNRVSNDPGGCGWRGGPKDQAGYSVTGFKTVAAAKEYLQGGPVSSYELCIDPPDKYLPGSGLGNEAWLDSCNANVALRLRTVVIEVVTTTEDVKEGSPADGRRTAAIARKAVKRMRKLRCPPSFCRGT
jgi:hypothetical protein